MVDLLRVDTNQFTVYTLYMLRRKKLARLRREREAVRKEALDRLTEKVERSKLRKLRLRRKELALMRLAEFKRKYNEDFADCKVHEPRSSWAMGPTTKKRSVLETY